MPPAFSECETKLALGANNKGLWQLHVLHVFCLSCLQVIDVFTAQRRFSRRPIGFFAKRMPAAVPVPYIGLDEADGDHAE